MVHTRSKARLLKDNSIIVVNKESPQPPPSTTSEYLDASSTTRFRKKKKKKTKVCEALQSFSSPSSALEQPSSSSTTNPVSTLSSKAIDRRSDDSEKDVDGPVLALSPRIFDSSDLQSNDINNDIMENECAFIERLNSWLIEESDLQWTKARRGKDCLIIGNFSYIFMSLSENKNLLNYRCQRRDRKCDAVVHLNLATRLFIDTNNTNHNHPPDQFMMKQKISYHEIDHRVATEPTLVLKIVERVYAKVNLTDEERLNLRLPKVAGKYFISLLVCNYIACFFYFI